MLKLQELEQQRAAVFGEAENIHKAAGNGVMSPEDRSRFDEKMRMLDEIDATIDRLQRLREQERSAPPAPGQEEPRGGASGDAKKFGTFGEFLTAVAEVSTRGRVDSRLVEDRATGLSEGIPSDGGFLVQTDFAAELQNIVHQTGAVSSRCRRIPISANANGVKLNAIAETSRADGSRLGGVLAYWLNEAGTKTASRPAFRQIELSLKKLIGLCYATDELLADAAALETVMRTGFGEEFGFKLDDAIINGTGAGQPLGLMASPALVTVAKEAGQPAATIVSENVIKMYSRMAASSVSNAVWYVNQNVFPQLYTMGITVGVGGSPIFQPAGGLSQSPYNTLLGRPIIPIEQCQTLGTTGDIIFADMSQYLLAEKGGIEMATSIHVKFVYDETAFRFVYRVDGQPLWNAALAPFKGGAGSTTSPFVALATRA